ncbi:hypothetical protein ABZ946_28845 [Streptomyces sp. NPDC046324]|uniref:hypothetical protein n=1 Tax=Streptomyces sp. NPDC046324 TaxID=3154915 RepID=UPI0033DD7025
MSKLVLLVVLLTVAVFLLCLAALGYVAYRHPRLVTPLMVVAAFAAAFAGALAVVVAL